MLADPPNKRGLNQSYIKNDKTFNNWKDVQDYQSKIQQMNFILENKDEKERKKKYKEELDFCLKKKKDNIKNLKGEELKGLNEKNKLIDLVKNKEIEDEITRKNLQLKMIKESEKNQMKLKNEYLRQKNLENEENKKRIEDIMEREKNWLKEQKIEKRKQGKEIVDYCNENIEYKKKIKEEEKLKEKKFQEKEEEYLKKTEIQRKNFLDKIKCGFKQNKNILEYYDKLYKKKYQMENEFEKNVIDKPAKEKYELGLKKEIEKKNEKSKQNEYFNKCIKNQIEEKKICSQRLYEQKKIHESSLINREIEKLDKLEKERKEKNKIINERQLNNIKFQIQERRNRLGNKDSMNYNEAFLNNNIKNINTDFIKPSNGTISGVPGLGQSYERTKQLKYIDLNLKNFSILKNKNGLTFDYDKDKKFDNYLNSFKKYDSLDKKLMEKEIFKNEYEFIKNKNTNNRFNIITNSLRNN